MRTTVPDGSKKQVPHAEEQAAGADTGREREQSAVPGSREKDAHAHQQPLHQQKKTSWLKQYYPFSAEVKQTSLPFLPSKKVKLKTSTLVQTKQLMHIIQVNCRNRLKLYPEEGETVLYSSQDLPQHLSKLLCRVAVVFTWVFCCKSFTAQ